MLQSWFQRILAQKFECYHILNFKSVYWNEVIVSEKDGDLNAARIVKTNEFHV